MNVRHLQSNGRMKRYHCSLLREAFGNSEIQLVSGWGALGERKLEKAGVRGGGEQMA